MESLPDELFENICRYLLPKDITSMMLVDSYSRILIENSPILMDKLPLYVMMDDPFSDVKNKRELEPLMLSRRKVRKVIVKLNKAEKIMEYLGIFQKFALTIKRLEIFDYVFETVDQLRIILRFLPKLKTLVLTNITFQRDENKILNSIIRIPKISLRELRNIFCTNSDPKLFSLFTATSDIIRLRAIRLTVSNATIYRYSEFIDFLKTQPTLKELTLKGTTADNSDIFGYGELPVNNLVSFELESCSVGYLCEKKCLVETIEKQSALKLLKILNSPLQSTNTDTISTYRRILFQRINELHVDIRDLLILRGHHFVNDSITRLTVRANFAFENLPVFINFIKIFPNIVYLRLVGDTPIGDKYLFHILSAFTKLQELHVPGFTSRTADSNFSNLSTLNCSKLQTLVLDFIDFDVKFFGWKNIVSALGSIKKLVVKRDYGKVSNEIIDLIIKNLKLQHLELGIGVVSEKILQNIVNSHNCDRLKVLKIARTDFEKIGMNFDFSRIYGTNHLLLHLCENEYFEPMQQGRIV